ncbi:hypothetical protein RvY_18461 [Ramazzottius varieornatus]|uniref:Uncharacterized protein n=1 Tax=Ramazzottius varieornatus TaxID=947166 RepID=A0A1D1W5V1_RAMVA|nr:hypothetical protein RvY_18461 [Ramazzottius varieornatus]
MTSRIIEVRFPFQSSLQGLFTGRTPGSGSHTYRSGSLVYRGDGAPVYPHSLHLPILFPRVTTGKRDPYTVRSPVGSIQDFRGCVGSVDLSLLANQFYLPRCLPILLSSRVC